MACIGGYFDLRRKSLKIWRGLISGIDFYKLSLGNGSAQVLSPGYGAYPNYSVTLPKMVHTFGLHEKDFRYSSEILSQHMTEFPKVL